jgi:hypothetical protein
MRAKIKPLRMFSIAACAIALAGCSGETQQQKFVDAMNHGNSAQASQIWLHMSAKNREDFAHNHGMSPNTSPDDIKKQITQHYADKMSGDNGENEGETIENPAPAPSVHLGGLESLPEWVGPSGAPPEAATLPKQDQPPPTATVPTQ